MLVMEDGKPRKLADGGSSRVFVVPSNRVEFRGNGTCSG